jgi:hypothetical protein
VKTNDNERASIGNNTLEDRARLRLKAANWVRAKYPQQWNTSREELQSLIDELGLWEIHDPPVGTKPARHLRVADCGPLSEPRSTKL